LFISIHTNSTEAKTTSATGADTYILGLARSEENKAVQQRENSVILLEDDYKQRYQGFDPDSPESHIIFEFMTNKFMEQSLSFADVLQKNFKTVARRNDRGVKQAGFLVLRETAMPSVLIELGFINNQNEAQYLASAIGQRALGSAIFAGFKQYKKEFDKKQGSSTITSDNSVQDEAQVYVSKPAQSVEQQPTATRPQHTQPVAQQPSTTNETYVSKPKQNPVEVPVQQPKKPVVVSQTEKKEVVLTKPVEKSTTKPDEIEYRVQILTSSSKIPSGSPRLKGVSPVSFYVQDGLFKYTYGSTTDRNEAVRLSRQIQSKFKDAFIVSFKNGKRLK
jgi:N-acetylmuramoyl-L-alanine amidase